MKTTVVYIFTPKNKICRNIALKITKYGKICKINLFNLNRGQHNQWR